MSDFMRLFRENLGKRVCDCGTEFMPYRDNQVQCSAACRTAAWRRRKEAEAAKPPPPPPKHLEWLVQPTDDCPFTWRSQVPVTHEQATAHWRKVLGDRLGPVIPSGTPHGRRRGG